MSSTENLPFPDMGFHVKFGHSKSNGVTGDIVVKCPKGEPFWARCSKCNRSVCGLKSINRENLINIRELFSELSCTRFRGVTKPREY